MVSMLLAIGGRQPAHSRRPRVAPVAIVVGLGTLAVGASWLTSAISAARPVPRWAGAHILTVFVVAALLAVASVVTAAWRSFRRLHERLRTTDSAAHIRSVSIDGPISSFRRPLALAALLTLIEALLALAAPWPLKIVVDNAVGGKPMPALLAGLNGVGRPVIAVIAAAVGVLLVAALCLVAYLASILSKVTTESAAAELRVKVLSRLMDLPLTFHDRHRSGDLVTRLTTDVSRAQDALIARIQIPLPNLVAIAGMTAMMALLSPMLALVVLAVVPSLALVGLLRRRKVTRAQRTARVRSGEMATRASELVRNVRAVQAFDQRSLEVQRFDTASRAVAVTEVDASTASARLAPAADLLLAIDLGIVLWIGTMQVAGHHLTVGGLLVFLTYLSALHQPVQALSRLGAILGRGAASRERLKEIFDTCPVPDTGSLHPIGLAAPALGAHNLSFEYQAGRPALDDVSFDVGAGETCCILGRSGAGKSTLLNMLLRLHEPDRGSVTLDGVDVREYSIRSLRQTIAFVPQDMWLLAGTIEENITYGMPGANRDAIRRAGRLALVDEFADRLPSGWLTQVGEGGALLSGGQRRRIALARALLQDAPVLLLDEPTAGLDAAGEALVIEAIRHAAQGRTVVVVTHRYGLVSLADQVVVLADGKVVEAGTPRALRAAGNEFAFLEALHLSTGIIASPGTENERELAERR